MLTISYIVLSAIATDPRWLPNEEQEAAAVEVFREQVSYYGDIEIRVSREGVVRFYDAGENFETAECPACHTILARNPSDMAWLMGQFDRCWSDDTGFWPLDVIAPCCGAPTSLNDLKYEAPQGFASWSVGAIDAQVWEFSAVERTAFEAALGHPFRLVYAHY